MIEMKYVGLFLKKLLRYLLKPLSFLPALAVMYLIFNFSAQDGNVSARLSLKVSHKAVEVADKMLDKGWSEAQMEVYTEKMHYYVRKTAHITEYFVLAVTISFPLYVYGLRGIWLVLFAGAFCVGFAALDEYHQSFVAGRGASGRDVAIDSIGVFAGIYCMRIVGWLGRMTLFRPLSIHKRET